MTDAALTAEIQRKAAALRGKHAAPLIAICLPTFNPPLDLLRQQIESLRAQTHYAWLCLISDDDSVAANLAAIKEQIAGDARFVVASNKERLGVYHNVERCLQLVPAQAEFVALADQDDRWYPHKLARLLAEYAQDDAQLIYSDLRVVAASGQVLAESYWTTWRNNQTDLVQLLFENTVTGAAALFRRSLLTTALPFPPRAGNLYHDHWLACVALALGRIRFVNEPLYDYVQHGGNVIGHFSPARRAWLGLATAALKRFASAPTAKLANIYEEKVHKPGVIAQALLQRTAMPATFLLTGQLCQKNAQALLQRTAMPAAKRTELQQLAQMEVSWPVARWLLRRGLRRLPQPGVGLPAELYALAGILWRRLS